MADWVTTMRTLAQQGSAAVTSAELVWVGLPLRRPHRAAHGIEITREVVLVGVSDGDGNVGWGECSALSSPTYTSEFTAGAFDVLAGSMIPALMAGQRWADANHPMASAGVETAVIDLALRRSGRSLVAALGATTDRVERCVVIAGGDTVDEVQGLIAQAVASGAAMVKLKVSPLWDPHILQAVATSWPDLPVAVDANGSIAHEQQLLETLDGHGVAYIEQPAPAGDDLALTAIAAGLSVPVAVDESVTTVLTLVDSVDRGSATVVNVKPSRVGGLVAALECIEAARSRHVAVFVGGMLETGVGRAAAVALAAAVASDPGLSSLPTDLGPSGQYFDSDITDPVVVDGDGQLVVPSGPGIGLVPHAERLTQSCVRRVTVGGQ